MMNWTARHKKLPQLGPTLASTLWIELYCVLYLGGDTSDVRDSGSSGLNSPAFNQTLNTLDLFLWRYFISFINVYTILLKTLLTVHYELQQLEANIQTGHIGHHLVIRVWTVDSCVTSITKLYFIVVFYTMSSLSSAIYNFNFSLALAYMHAYIYICVCVCVCVNALYTHIITLTVKVNHSSVRLFDGATRHRRCRLLVMMANAIVIVIDANVIFIHIYMWWLKYIFLLKESIHCFAVKIQLYELNCKKKNKNKRETLVKNCI